MSTPLAGTPGQASGFAASTAQAAPHSQRRSAAIIIAAVSLLFAAIYGLRFNEAAGLVGDDAWYALLAKALATGQGFSLISSPLPGILPSYPPGFPLLLSLIFKVAPRFPENAWLLKAVSILAMYGTGAVTYRYLTRSRGLSPQPALGAAVVVVLMPAFVFLATSTVMSECVFTLSQLLTVAVMEACVESKDRQIEWRLAAAGAVLASFTFLTRSVAIGLIAAVMLYLLKEKAGAPCWSLPPEFLWCLRPGSFTCARTRPPRSRCGSTAATSFTATAISSG